MRGRVAQRGAREERARRVRRRHTSLRAATARHHPFRSHLFVYLLYTSATLISYTLWNHFWNFVKKGIFLHSLNFYGLRFNVNEIQRSRI